MKQIFSVLLILMLLLSACGKKETQTATADPDAAEKAAAAQQGLAPSPSFSEQDVLFPPADHPPLSETVSDGGERSTAYGYARSEAVYQDYTAFWDYMEQQPDSPLQGHLAGAYKGDISICLALVICLDEPENKALLDEIAGIGLKTDYRIEKGVGTKAYLEKCLPEITEKLNALSDKVKNGSATDEEKELIRRYKPRNPSLWRDQGQICVEVTIKTPWYSIGENWGIEDMNRDLEHCKELFFKLIGYEDVMGFGYGV